MAPTEPRQIAWSSARVEDETLTVELTGSVSKAWRARFDRVLALLDTPHSSWGQVRVSKNAINVAEVQQGDEERLRHFLESIVLEANSGLEPDIAESDGDGSDEPDARERDHEPDPDQQMTAAFKAFDDERP